MKIELIDPRDSIKAKDPEGKLNKFIDEFSIKGRTTAQIADAIEKVVLGGKGAGLDDDSVRTLVSDIQKKQGIAWENKILDTTESSLGQAIKDRNDKLHFKELTTNVTLCGKIDGQLEDGVLIEAKRRVRRIFGVVPEYERVQIHLYMSMLDVRKALLVESVGEKSMQHKIKFDKVFMQTITGELDEAVELVRRCMEGDAVATKTVLIDLQPKQGRINLPT